MKSWKACSVLAAGWLVAGCATSQQAKVQAVGETAAPAAPGPAGEFTADSSRGFGSGDDAQASDAAPAAPPTAAAPTGSDTASARGSGRPARAEASRSEAKKRSPVSQPEERPGLGTTWGETMTSRVSNAPFERASDSPFSLSTVHYNDQSGISAMLRGGSFVDFRSEGSSAGNGVLTVRLTDENGSSLPTFQSQGRTLVQGEIGQRYMISISNQSSNRFEAVVTVDGLDVIDGRAGSFAKRGYLIQPFGSVEIDGFRQSMDEVAAFRFGSVRGSYAAQKGSDRNVGVIGVAVFAERGARQVWNQRELSRRESADAFPGRFATPAGR
jgi:hypothetical protein